MIRRLLGETKRGTIIRLLARLGLYTKNACGDGRYYYVVGPLLDFPRFAVIREDLEEKPDEWVKDWMTGKPAAVLVFAFWKLNCRHETRASADEAEWFYGFQVADARAIAKARA